MTNINIKLVSPEVTELNFNLDGNCDLCKRGLHKLLKLQKQNPDAYGSKNRVTGRSVGKIELVPDHNAHGIVTHWHIR